MRQAGVAGRVGRIKGELVKLDIGVTEILAVDGDDIAAPVDRRAEPESAAQAMYSSISRSRFVIFGSSV